MISTMKVWEDFLNCTHFPIFEGWQKQTFEILLSKKLPHCTQIQQRSFIVNFLKPSVILGETGEPSPLP